MVMRKMGNAASPTVEITEEDGVYSLKVNLLGNFRHLRRKS